MKTLQIPGVSFPVFKICLGCAYFGTRNSQETSFEILDYYFEQGGRFFNTAHEYGFGKSEETLGKWIRDRGVRDQIVLTTKGGEDMEKPPYCADMHRDALLQDIDESLQRLQLDCVDFYLLHLDDETVSVPEIMDTMEEIVKAGKARHYGCSNWSLTRQREADAYAKQHGLQGFVMDEIAWSLVRSKNDNHSIPSKWLDEFYIAQHEKDGKCVAGYSPLAEGCLSKIIRDGDARNLDPSQVNWFMTSYSWEVSRRLKKLCDETGWTATQIQLACLLNAPYRFPSFLILGASKPVQLEDGLKALDMTITAEMMDYLRPDPRDFSDLPQLYDR